MKDFVPSIDLVFNCEPQSKQINLKFSPRTLPNYTKWSKKIHNQRLFSQLSSWSLNGFMLSVYNIDLLKNTFNRTLKFGPNITRKCNLPLLCEYDDLLVRILLDFKGIKFKLEIQKVWLCQFTRSSSSILLQIFYFTRPKTFTNL